MPVSGLLSLLPAFASASVQGLPLFVVVLAAVSYVKSLGVKGNALRLASLALGVLLGVGYQLTMLAAQPGLPAAWSLAAWALTFAILVYGLALGVLASLLYDLGPELVAKALQQLAIIGRTQLTAAEPDDSGPTAPPQDGNVRL